MCSAVTDRDNVTCNRSNENYELPSSSSQCRQAQLVFSSAQQDPPDFPQNFNDVDQKILSTSQQILNDEVQDPPSNPVLDLNNVSLLDSVTVSLTNNQLNPPAQKSPQTYDKVLKSFSHAPSDSEPNSLNCSKVYPESLVNCCLTKLNDTLMAKLNYDDSNEILKKTTTKAKGDKSSKTKAKKNIKRGKKVDTKKAKRQVLQEKNNDTDCEDDFKADSRKMKEKLKQGRNKIKRNKDTGPAKTKKRKINK
ncbi:unnamed protein product [Parnassius apollo]|uniref:(apollo) hypothetical protein n=1 Tax=Parnassius apollo TaxID=110799 RepID=A0A8S3WY31_PARAO|nr:unnamed protein product [Parnassius apollo]